MAIMDAILKPFGGKRTGDFFNLLEKKKQIVHVGTCGKGPTQSAQREGSNQGDGRMDDVTKS